MAIIPFDHKVFIKTLPRKPGVYQFYDIHNELIYIGKAKNLKDRVTSYFVKGAHSDNAKTRMLVSKINDIKFTLVDTEIDAWLLENSLIKKHQPKYNILLKDDKTFPYICIKNERFPRIFSTRQVIKDGSKYFGPYASVKMMHTILDFIKTIFPLRNCNLSLSKENIDAEKFKVCLEYQIGNCKGPCQAYQSEESYNESIQQIIYILKGNITSVVEYLNEQIKKAVTVMNFEEAQLLKEKIDLLKSYQSKSTVVSTSISNIDVFSIASDDKYAFVNYLKVMNGAIIQTQTLELRKKLNEDDKEVLSLAISEFRTRFNSSSKEIIVPFPIDIEGDLKFIVPQLGEKKKLLELSEKNVHYFRKAKMDNYEQLNPEIRTERVLNQLMKDLRLKEIPRHIECFDNSNFQGKFPVSAMVVFKDAKPSKKDYRHFNVKTVVGSNDFATMEEVVFRRYSRALAENQDLPNLIIVDGGKGQLSSAYKVLESLGLNKKIPIIGIAKRLEELYYPNDSIPLYLDKRSESLKIIQQLRDEAHRFGITFHRQIRNKATLKTELEEVPGIGGTTATKLLKKFKSFEKIRTTDALELEKIIGKQRTALLLVYLKTKETPM